MKSICLLIIILIFLLHLPCFGQFPQNWGILGGISSSNQKYLDKQSGRSGSFDNKYGFRVGILGEFFDHRYFNLVGDLSYIQRGTKDDDLMVTRVADNDWGFENMGYLDQRLDYIALTILSKGKYNFGFFIPYITIGPSFSYLVGGNEQVEFYLDKFNKFVLGLTFGAGTAINVNLPFLFLLELRYNQDLTNAYENDITSLKNYTYEFLIGIKF